MGKKCVIKNALLQKNTETKLRTNLYKKIHKPNYKGLKDWTQNSEVNSQADNMTEFCMCLYALPAKCDEFC